MSCCCKGKSETVSCLGRCDLPKHHCLEKEDVKPGPIPRHLGWLYTAKTSPEHQLRCGWRPGHISCPVLRRIYQHHCYLASECCSNPCGSGGGGTCSCSCAGAPRCLIVYPSEPDVSIEKVEMIEEKKVEQTEEVREEVNVEHVEKKVEKKGDKKGKK